MTAIEGGEVAGLREGHRGVGSAADGPTAAQWVGATALVLGLVWAFAAAPFTALDALHLVLVAGFAFSASSKLALAAFGRPPAEIAFLRRDRLPRYTILVPLYREAAVVRQLVAGLCALDYPRDRLQAILILEEDDDETLDALAWLHIPPFIEILVNQAGGPRTKPNALNTALPLVRGEFVVVYDAEDVPHPDQLKEAAARFRADPALACLQAPLRIGNAGAGFLARQFALEYAGQFDAVLPGLAGLGANFPLGGTSNHLRTEIVRRLGGWDAHNVTEDADLGFRLGERRRVGMMAAPTREDAPVSFDEWLPQRTRWVKGYMQTWGVHMRRPSALGLKGFLALQATLGMAILGAMLHAPLVLLLVATLLTDLFGAVAAPSVLVDLSVLASGWSAASLANALGAKRAGLSMRFTDAVASLAYWPLQSLAFAFAVRQLIFAPHHWDKTPHAPVAEDGPSAAPLDAPLPRRVSPAA